MFLSRPGGQRVASASDERRRSKRRPGIAAEPEGLGKFHSALLRDGVAHPNSHPGCDDIAAIPDHEAVPRMACAILCEREIAICPPRPRSVIWNG
jgi:hypothetical protein